MAAQLLTHFTPLIKLPPHSHMAAQLLAHFTPSEEFTPHSYAILPPPPWAAQF